MTGTGPRERGHAAVNCWRLLQRDATTAPPVFSR